MTQFLTTNIKFKDANMIDIKAEETHIGWFIGYKLYCKTITYTGAFEKNADTNIPHGISNLETILSATLYSPNTQSLFPYVALSGGLTAITKYDDTNITVRTYNDSWSSKPWRIILYYIKQS